MKAYSYDSVSKRYIGEVNCQLDPLETQTKGEEVWLLPANCTWEAPLEHKDGYDVVWNGNEWEYQEIIQPEPPVPTKEEQRQARANAYQQEVDPITSHISRLRDEEQTEEILAEINDLIAERTAKVAEIKERLPYPDEE